MRKLFRYCVNRTRPSKTNNRTKKQTNNKTHTLANRNQLTSLSVYMSLSLPQHACLPPVSLPVCLSPCLSVCLPPPPPSLSLSLSLDLPLKKGKRQKSPALSYTTYTLFTDPHSLQVQTDPRLVR